jgi:hypothetical protein
MDACTPSSVLIPMDHAELPVDVVLPPHAQTLVLFAEGRHRSLGPHDRQVATALSDLGLGTLLVDLFLPQPAAWWFSSPHPKEQP